MLNPKLGKTDEREIGARMRPVVSEKHTMLDEETDSAESDPETLRLKQAQAMLNLFETDRGRVAVTLEEIKEWAYTQDHEQLQFRVDQFLSKSESRCLTDGSPL